MWTPLCALLQMRATAPRLRRMQAASALPQLRLQQQQPLPVVEGMGEARPPSTSCCPHMQSECVHVLSFTRELSRIQQVRFESSRIQQARFVLAMRLRCTACTAGGVSVALMGTV